MQGQSMVQGQFTGYGGGFNSPVITPGVQNGQWNLAYWVVPVPAAVRRDDHPGDRSRDQPAQSAHERRLCGDAPEHGAADVHQQSAQPAASRIPSSTPSTTARTSRPTAASTATRAGQLGVQRPVHQHGFRHVHDGVHERASPARRWRRCSPTSPTRRAARRRLSW